MRRLAAIVALVAFVGAPRGAQALSTPLAPACVRENSCGFTACYGSPTAAVHYFCDCSTTGTVLTVALGGQQPTAGCVAGDDTANNGTSASTPWRSLTKAQTTFNNAAAGDQILFCNGGSWDLTGASSDRWGNSNATANNRVVAGSYNASWATGTEGRPIWKLPLGTRAVNFDHGGGTIQGLTFAGIQIEGINQPATPTASSPICGSSPCPFEGFFVYDGINDVLICDMRIAYVSIAVENAGGNSNQDNQRIVVRNSVIEKNDGQGWLGGGTDNWILYNAFQNNGAATANLNHHIYLSSNNSTGMLVMGNDLYKNAHVGGGKCNGAMLVMHGLFASCTISGNQFREDDGDQTGSCYCNGINPGYSSMEAFQNIVITGNVYKNCGQEGVSISACHNCSVDANICLADTSSGFECIAATNDGTGSGGGDWDNDQVKIRANTCHGSGCGIRTANTGTNITVIDNVMDRTDSGTVSCFTESLSTGAYTAINNNACFAPGTIQWNATTLASWRSSSGFDANSIQGVTPGSPPGFTNARISTTYSGAASDFTPASGSVLIGAGTLGVSVDFLGHSYLTPPSIGAVEPFTSVTGAKGSLGVFGGF